MPFSNVRGERPFKMDNLVLSKAIRVKGQVQGQLFFDQGFVKVMFYTIGKR
jgi:hypothetical protein|nr:hypothetical protein Q903MT_gene2687 [Picea sitchensis]